MKKLIFLLSLICGVAVAQVGPPPATPAEAAAGMDRYKYLTPYAASQGGLSSPTGGISVLTAVNIAATNSAYYATNGAGVFVGYTTNLQLGSSYAVEAFGPGATNALNSDGIGAWTYNRYNVGGGLVERFPQSIDFQFSRYENNQTATPGNAILWGVGCVAGNNGSPVQDNAVIVNGTQNTNWGLESIIVNGTHISLKIDDTTSVAQSAVLNGEYITQRGQHSVWLNGTNSNVGGYGNLYGGRNVNRSNAWEFYWGESTNGISVMPTNGTIAAVGTMRFLGNAGGLDGITNLWALGATNSLIINNGTQTNRSRVTISAASPFPDLDTPYTNRNQQAFVQFNVSCTTVLGSGDIAYAYLLVDQNSDGTYEENDNYVGVSDLTASTSTYQISRHLQPGARFMLAQTNASFGIVAIVSSRIDYR